MAKTLIVPSKFTAEDGMTGVLDNMGRKVQYAAQKMDMLNARSERLFRKLTPSLSAASKQMLSMVGTGALVAGAFQLGHSTIQSVMDYETAMQSLQAVTGSSNEQMVGFKDEVNTLARTSKKSAKDVASSFETIGSAMSQYLDDPKGLHMIADAGITLSKASRTELQPTLENLTSIMNQFGLRAEAAAKSVDILTAGEIVGSIRTSEAAEYLKDFGATAKNMNVDLSESTALIEALGVQMSKDKIGVGARNLLTIISAAGGLDKKAVKDLKSAGVDTKVLMDNTQSLSVRLHELSKISKDPIKMVSVFGKENLTAGQVIFNQLDKYDKFVGQIRTTSMAQEQAAINSDTLSNRLEELSNSWSNMMTSSKGATSGLSQAKRAIQFVAENLDSIVSGGMKFLKFFALWKAQILVTRAAIGAYNIMLGLSAGATGIYNIAVGKSQLALKAATAAQWAMNVAMGANPVGLLIIGVAALAAGLAFLAYRHEQLVEQYKKEIDLKTIEQKSAERKAVDALSRSYMQLGMSQKEALFTSIALQRQSLKMEMAATDEKIATARKTMKENSVMGGRVFGEFSKEYKQAENDLVNSSARAKELSAKHLALVEQTAEGVSSGLFDRTAASKMLNSKVDGKSVKTPEQMGKDQIEKNRVARLAQLQSEGMSGNFSSTKVTKSEVTKNNNASAKATITIENKTDNPVSMKGDDFDKRMMVMPSMTSTMQTKK